MKLPRISLAALGFAVLVVAVDFALIRAAFVGGLNKSAYFVILLMPMLDVLLVRGFRLRRPERRTGGSIGFLVAGSLAFAAIYISCLAAPEIVLSGLREMAMPLATKCIAWTTRLFGNRVVQSTPGMIVIALSLEVMLPALLLCAPPTAVAYAGRWLGRRSERTIPPGSVKGKASALEGGALGLLSAA